jgi:hypothetical protein
VAVCPGGAASKHMLVQVLGINELSGVYVVHQVHVPGHPGAPQNFLRGIRTGLINYSAAILNNFVAAKKTIITILMGFLLWVENYVLLDFEV